MAVGDGRVVATTVVMGITARRAMIRVWCRQEKVATAGLSWRNGEIALQ